MSAGLLLLAALIAALLLVAWLAHGLRGAGRPDPEQLRRQLNIAAYQERKTQLGAAHAAGDIDEAEYQRLQQELDERLLAEAGAAPVQGDTTAPGKALRAAVLLTPLLLTGGVFWLSDGAQHFRVGAPANEPPGSIEEMVAGLAQKLEQTPDDVDGWVLLGRSYGVMERFADAAQAYGRANQLTGGRDPDLLVAEGEMLALARERDLLGRPSRLFDEALALDPGNIRALWYAALAASQGGEELRAEALFARLRARPDLPAELREILGVAGAGEGGSEPAPPAQAAAAAGPRLQVEVGLDPGLRDKLPSDATLFVFARASGGPPMPLAVQRMPVGAFPRTVILDESMAMMEGLSLSRFPRWEIVARVTASGNVRGESGDLEGLIEADAETAQPLALTIDRRLP